MSSFHELVSAIKKIYNYINMFCEHIVPDQECRTDLCDDQLLPNYRTIKLIESNNYYRTLLKKLAMYDIPGG